RPRPRVISMSEWVMSQKSVAVVVVAAGRGERAGSGGETQPKQYRLVGGETVLARTLKAFLQHSRVTWVLPVIHPDHGERFAASSVVEDERLLAPVHGGATRQASVLAGLKALAPLQ